MNEKTRALTFLEEHHISYRLHEYPSVNGPVAAMDVAAYMGFSVDRLVKTLVTTDHKGGYYVFCLPASKRIDMKKAAQTVGAKNLTMLQPEIFEELTGYVHGGCSPFGLKTALPIYVQQEVFSYETVYLSGGRVGLTVEVDPKTLLENLNAEKGDFVRE